jgi:hypothetical protein
MQRVFAEAGEIAEGLTSHPTIFFPLSPPLKLYFAEILAFARLRPKREIAKRLKISCT